MILIVENHLKKLMKTVPSLKYEFGWGNGYVLLPPSHPYFGLHYDNIDVDIHGGLTLSQSFDANTFLEWTEGLEIDGNITRKNYQNFDGYWMIGFDTAHYGDDMIRCSKEYVLEETKSLLDQCNKEFKRLRRKKLNKLNEL